METVVIVIHLMVIIALIAVVLLQRSEGGALGIGGGNNFLSSRGQGNVLTRATGILAAAFFATSILMSILARMAAPPSSILDSVPAATAPVAPITDTATPGTTTAPATGTGGILDELNAFTGEAGATDAPAADTGTAAPADGATTTEPPAATTTPPAQQVPTTP